MAVNFERLKEIGRYMAPNLERLREIKKEVTEETPYSKVLDIYFQQPIMIGYTADTLRRLNFNNAGELSMYNHAVWEDFEYVTRDMGFVQKNECKELMSRLWHIFEGSYRLEEDLFFCLEKLIKKEKQDEA